MSERACLCGSTSCKHGSRHQGRRKPGTYGGLYQSNRAFLVRKWTADPQTRCYFDGRTLADHPTGSKWSPEHIIPVSEGGGDHLSNLAPAVLACNLAAGARLKQRKARERNDARAARVQAATLELIEGGRR